jgi:hypothetical protein
MSKKVKRKPAKKAVKVVKKTAKRAPAKRRSARKRLADNLPAPTKRTAAATIFVYETGSGTRVRTSPQLLTSGPGYIEWTVVNLSSDAMPDVDISWPDGSPWGGAPIPIRGGNVRKSLDGAAKGRFKYNVTCNGFTEDPEVEYPEN